MQEAFHESSSQPSKEMAMVDILGLFADVEKKHKELEALHLTDPKGNGLVEEFYEESNVLNGFVDGYDEVLHMDDAETRHVGELISRLYLNRLTDDEKKELALLIQEYTRKAVH